MGFNLRKFLIITIVLLLLFIFTGLLYLGYKNSNRSFVSNLSYYTSTEVSEISKLKVRHDRLDTLLQSMNFHSNYKRLTSYDLKSITFTITSQAQIMGIQETNTKKSIQSWGSTYEPDRNNLIIYLYLDPQIISTYNEDQLSKAYSTSALQELYTLLEYNSIYQKKYIWKVPGEDVSDRETIIYFLEVEKRR